MVLHQGRWRFSPSICLPLWGWMEEEEEVECWRLVWLQVGRTG